MISPWRSAKWPGTSCQPPAPKNERAAEVRDDREGPERRSAPPPATSRTDDQSGAGQGP